MPTGGWVKKGYRLLSLDDLDTKGRRVLVRLDLNVPLVDGKISDDSRIRESLPTIRKLISSGSHIVLTSHLGRPGGNPVASLSLAPVREKLSNLLDQDIDLVGGPLEGEPLDRAAKLGAGKIMLLENIRFYSGEEKNDPAFCKALAKLGDIFVHDAFGTVHRAHASTEGVPRILKPSAAGYLILKELGALEKLTKDPRRPFAALIGGAKISGKINVLKSLLDKVDKLIIGGAMAYTFFRARGLEIGNSLCEDDHLATAREVEEEAKKKNVELLLPVDNVVAPKLAAGVPTKVVPSSEIPSDWEGLDIGPASTKIFKDALADCRTVFWNGPLGAFEIPPFDKGTRSIGSLLAELDATTIIGGGDSAAAVRQAGLASKMTHISTGGGASMEYIQGKDLPGLAALDQIPL